MENTWPEKVVCKDLKQNAKANTRFFELDYTGRNIMQL